MPPFRSAHRLAPRARFLVALIVAVPTIICGPWLYLRGTTASSAHGPHAVPRHAQAAIVLGAKVGDDGVPSPFLQERVARAVELYNDGAVDVLIMTGDGSSRPGYDEPGAMRELALAAGVPDDAILLDREGLNTRASCDRAAANFGITSAVVVTQEFHVARATWLCRQAGIDVQGAYPAVGGRMGTYTGNIREVAAAWKAVLGL